MPLSFSARSRVELRSSYGRATVELRFSAPISSLTLQNETTFRSFTLQHPSNQQALRATPLSLWALLLAVLISSIAVAQKQPVPNQALTKIEVLPEVTSRQGNRTVNATTGAVRTLLAENYQTAPGTPEGRARQFLEANVGRVGLDQPDLRDLRLHSVREGKATTVVRFEQHVDEVPVLRARVIVSIDPEGVVRYVSSSYEPGVVVASMRATLAPALSKTVATNYLGVVDGVSSEIQDTVILPRGAQSRLVHRSLISPLRSPQGDWEVLVDAITGAVLRSEDRAAYAGAHEDRRAARRGVTDGDGETFDPDPLSSANATYGDTGFVDGGDATTTQLEGELMMVSLLDITDDGGTFSLTGPWAEITDHDPPFKGLFTQASSTFNFTRDNDAFEAVTVYFHIDSLMRYLNVTLALDIRPYQYATGVRADPSGFSGADNSSYSTGTGRLRFGEGGVDDAEDSDVIHHELGHGLHDWVTAGGLSQVNGLSEGTGDYTAQSYNRSLGSWSPADPAYHWVFRWDGHNEFWSGRVTNYEASYDGGLTGSIHTDGQIWATCNMLIWDSIGNEASDVAFWEGLAMTGSSTNQEDAAQAVLQAAADLGYSGGTLTDMFNIYANCGYDVMAVAPSVDIFSDGFESGDTTAWSSVTP